LQGSANYRRILLARPEDLIANVKFARTYYVHIDSSVKEVAYLMEKYKYNTIPVVDDAQALQGLVTVDDILEQLIAMAWRRMKHLKGSPTDGQP
jgi:Mg/Co/Ni transporter MgtE